MAKRVDRTIDEFKTSYDLSNEISRLKVDIRKEITNCDDFEVLWQSFLNEKNISQVLNSIDSSNRKQEETRKEFERKRILEQEERRKREQAAEQPRIQAQSDWSAGRSDNFFMRPEPSSCSQPFSIKLWYNLKKYFL